MTSNPDPASEVIRGRNSKIDYFYDFEGRTSVKIWRPLRPFRPSTSLRPLRLFEQAMEATLSVEKPKI